MSVRDWLHTKALFASSQQIAIFQKGLECR